MLSLLEYQSQLDLNPKFQTKNHKSNLQTQNSQFLQYDVYSGGKKEYLTRVIFVVFFSLNNDTSKLSSPLVGKKVPEFSLPNLFGQEELTNLDLNTENPILLNVWSSWCIPCRAEHDILMVLSELYEVEIFGLNYKDNSEEAKKFINNLGNPFVKIGSDNSGRTAIDLGVYGVPETYIIANGIIIYKHIGPIHMNEMEEKILPIIRNN